MCWGRCALTVSCAGSSISFCTQRNASVCNLRLHFSEGESTLFIFYYQGELNDTRAGRPSSSRVVCCHWGLTLTRGVVERPVLILRCVDRRFRGSRRRRQRTQRSQNSQKHKVQKHNKHYNPERVNSHSLGSNPKKGTETCTNTKQHMQRMQPSTKKRQGYISWG